MGKRFLDIIVFIAIAICVILIWRLDSDSIPVTRDLKQGKIVAVPLTTGEEFTGILNSIRWEDVISTAESLSSDPKRRINVLEADTSHPPAIYLQALLAMAENRLDFSLEKFSRLRPEEIPAEMLYTPFRLYATLKPTSENPYKAPLMAAVESGKAPPLIIARMNAFEGKLANALKAYFKTDPAQWSNLEIKIFNNFILHAGLHKDATAMIAGALNGGRVPEQLKPQLLNLLPKDGALGKLQELKNNWLKMAAENPEIKKAALKAAEKQLSLRQKFLEKNYQGILKDYHGQPPLEAADETVLILTLAAAKYQDSPAFSIWSQELERRYPNPEVQAWLEKIRLK